MSESEPILSIPNGPTEDEESIDLQLWPWQIDALFNCDNYGFVAISGGRGAGKSYLDPPFVMRLSELPKDLYFFICAPTEVMLQTVLAEVRQTVDDFGINYVYGPQAPREWREQWDADGIAYPPPRFRNDRFWIWEDGTHFFTFSLVNNAYTRAKGLNANVIYGQEWTEPGVIDDMYTTLIGCLRCGKATRQKDGTWRCVVPGHWHQIRTVFNVPLRNPSHFMYKKMRRMQEQETARLAQGKQPYFKLIQVRTQDNKATGDSYVEMLASAWDENTFIEQTSGDILNPATNALTYHAFSANNILGMKEKNTAGPGLYYDPHAPLHVWFDFNTTPAVAGWGHDLRLDDVPPSDIKAGREYFGVIGELFSDNDPMHTDQVAKALLEDPTVKTPLDGRCVESGCGHPIAKHMNMGARGFLCSVCEWKPEPGSKMFCSGQPIGYEFSRKYIHAPPNWRGLVKHRGKIFIYADASGEQEHAAAVKGPSLSILRKMFGEAIASERLSFRTKKANPRIVNRELAVNRSLRSQAGIHTLFIGAWCSAHIADLREVVPDPKTGTAKKVQWTEAAKKKGDEYPKRGHLLDALGYMVDYRWPFLMPKSGGLPAMAEAPDFGPLETDWPRV